MLRFVKKFELVERSGKLHAMAGWDEGNVFYSDQQLEDTDINASDAATRHTAQRKFKEFIRSFGDVKGPFPYRFVFITLRIFHCFDQVSSQVLTLAVQICRS